MINRREFIGGVVGVGMLSFFDVWAQQNVPSWAAPGSPPLFFDDYKLIVQRDMDGGDTAQREGFCWFGMYLLSQKNVNLDFDLGLEWKEAVVLLEIESKGIFRRHPNEKEWWSDPKKFSRDQLIPIVAALGALGPRDSLDRVWQEFKKTRGICQNGDAGSPDLRNLFIRATADDERIESFGEGQLVAQSFLCGADGLDDVGKDLNYIVYLAAAKLWRKTQTSEEATLSYVNNRPTNYGCYLQSYRKKYQDLVDLEKMNKRMIEGIASGWTADCHPIIGALRWYFRPESGAGWGPAAIYEKVLSLYFPEMP